MNFDIPSKFLKSNERLSSDDLTLLQQLPSPSPVILLIGSYFSANKANVFSAFFDRSFQPTISQQVRA